MIGKFTTAAEVARETMDWGVLAWLSRPAATGAQALTVVEAVLWPNGGHNFHKHPNQEEVIYVIEGVIEQWLGKNSQVLKAGDSIFIDKDAVHASFNVSENPAKFLAILGPCVGEGGYEMVEVFDQEPWRSLRP